MSSVPRFDRPSSIPRPLTPLVGRERHVDAICNLLRQPDAHLVTLIGPGGIGKTRLALAAAERLHDDWNDGAVFVALQSISNPQFVASAIAQALGVLESGNQLILDSLRATLQTRHLLLVLDNFEQVLPAAPLISDLLTACPNLTVLVTSRAVLHLYGEHAYPIPPLDLPDPARLPPLARLAEVEAIRLFVERAQAATPAFALTVDNGPIIAAICARVDSLPLAIELAAARTRMLSPTALLARLERRLPILAGGPRDVPTRQQTMQDTIAWSYDLLTDHQQRLFRRLAVFAGGWTLEAAEAIGNSDPSRGSEQALDVMNGLGALLDHSLVRQVEQPSGSTRYTMLETLREYGRDRLAEHHELDDVFERHASFFQAMAEEAVPRLHGRDPVPALNQLAADQDNLRAALQWLHISGDAQRGLCMVGHLREFWYRRGHLTEGRAQAAMFLDMPGASRPTTCRALALTTAAWLAVWQSASETILYAEEALAILRTAEDETHVPFLLLILGLAADDIHDDQEQERLYNEQSLAIARIVGDTKTVARTLSNLGNLARKRGQRDQAFELIQESMTVSREAGDSETYALTLGVVALMALDAGDPDYAAKLFQERLRLFWNLDHTWGIQRTLHFLATTAIARKQPETATRLLAAVATLQAMTGIVPGAPDRQYLEAVETLQSMLVDMLGDAAFQVIWEQASTRSLADAVAEVLADGTAPTPPPVASTPATPSHSLSPRELDVLRGIVDGMSNQEIASALFISPNTVTNHVANIMNKLGLDSRTAVATWAVRNNIE